MSETTETPSKEQEESQTEASEAAPVPDAWGAAAAEQEQAPADVVEDENDDDTSDDTSEGTSEGTSDDEQEADSPAEQAQPADEAQAEEVGAVTEAPDETAAPERPAEGAPAAEQPAEEAPAAEEPAAKEETAATTQAKETADAEAEAEAYELERVPPIERSRRLLRDPHLRGLREPGKANLESRISSMNVEDRIFEVVIPMEDVMEIKQGKKQVVQKKVFPGYLLVRMYLDDDSWYVVRNTPGVTGFVGSGAKPTPLSDREIDRILQVKPEDKKKLKSPPRVRGAGERASHLGSVRQLHGIDLRDQRRPVEAQGAGQHLRSRDPGRARLRPGREALGGEIRDGEQHRWHSGGGVAARRSPRY